MQSLRTGARLAPHEPGVQLKALWLGLPRWDTLEDSDRARLRHFLTRLLRAREYFRPAASIALHHGREDLVRAVLERPWQHRSLVKLLDGRSG